MSDYYFIPGPWECPRCHRWNAPFSLQCDCADSENNSAGSYEIAEHRHSGEPIASGDPEVIQFLRYLGVDSYNLKKVEITLEICQPVKIRTTRDNSNAYFQPA